MIKKEINLRTMEIHWLGLYKKSKELHIIFDLFFSPHFFIGLYDSTKIQSSFIPPQLV